MSRAFDSLTIPAGIVLVLIILNRTINKGAVSIAQFIADNLIYIAIFLTIITLIICIVILKIRSKNNMFPILDHVLYIISAFLVIAQNFAFLLSGLHAAFFASSDSGLLTLLGIAGVLLFYIINAFFTVGSVIISIEKAYGFWLPLLVFAGGIFLIIS